VCVAMYVCTYVYTVYTHAQYTHVHMYTRTRARTHTHAHKHTHTHTAAAKALAALGTSSSRTNGRTLIKTLSSRVGVTAKHLPLQFVSHGRLASYMTLAVFMVFFFFFFFFPPLFLYIYVPCVLYDPRCLYGACVFGLEFRV
jgi:hypothetical protein